MYVLTWKLNDVWVNTEYQSSSIKIEWKLFIKMNKSNMNNDWSVYKFFLTCCRSFQAQMYQRNQSFKKSLK